MHRTQHCLFLVLFGRELTLPLGRRPLSFFEGRLAAVLCRPWFVRGGSDGVYSWMK